MITLGIISDTHGLLRPEALKALRNTRAILHAGDIGNPKILQTLRKIAPVFAVRGNNDREEWANSIPETWLRTIEGRRIFMIHNIHEMKEDPAAKKWDIVVYGHSHRPVAENRNGILFLNPGSAGPRRFHLPVTIARIQFTATSVQPEFVNLIPVK